MMDRLADFATTATLSATVSIFLIEAIDILSNSMSHLHSAYT
jgi:hypothetical protein